MPTAIEMEIVDRVLSDCLDNLKITDPIYDQVVSLVRLLVVLDRAIEVGVDTFVIEEVQAQVDHCQNQLRRTLSH